MSTENVRTYPVGRHELKIDRVTYPTGAEVFRVVVVYRPHPDPLGPTTQSNYESDTLALATALADYADRELLGNRMPELHERAAELKQRDRTLATATRQVFRGIGTGLILGDTPPDELPRPV